MKNFKLPHDEWATIVGLLTRTTPPNLWTREQWSYMRLVLATFLLFPILLYGAYAFSVISPGYEPLAKAGFWAYFARLIFLNSGPNPGGLMLLLLVAAVVLGARIRAGIERLQWGGGPEWAVSRPALVAYLIGILAVPSIPVIHALWFSSRSPFDSSGQYVIIFIVLFPLWCGLAGRFWKK